jgi:hypothetical protein
VLLIWVAAQSNQPILFSEDRICTIFEGIVWPVCLPLGWWRCFAI